MDNVERINAADCLPGGPGKRYDKNDDDTAPRGGDDCIISYRNPGDPGVPDEDDWKRQPDTGRGEGDPTIPDEDYEGEANEAQQ